MAEELKTVLGFDASKAIQTVRELTASLNAYSVSMKAAAKATSGFNRSAKGFEANALAINKAVGRTGQVADNSAKAINTLGQQTTNAIGPTGKLSGAQNNAAKSASILANEIFATQKGTKNLAETTKKASNDMVLSWKSVIRIFAIQVIHQAISQISSALKQSTEDSREYVKALSEIQTIADGGFGGLENLAAKVEEFSAATGQPLTAVTEGIYQTLSNQVADAANSFEFLQAASDFSIAAVTDLGSAVELLSSVINSYQLNASDAADISGKLFRAIELGRFRGEEIAETIGRITVLSSQLGVSLEETLASITVLTRSGMKYNEAFTLVSNIQLKLIKPTQALKDRFKEMGVATSEAGIQAYGFQGLLLEIEKGAGKTASELANLYGRVRAIRGALGLGSKFMETYTSDLKELKEAAAETIEEAKNIVFETNAKQVELELNRLNIALINFGRGATDVTKVVFDSFGGATGTVKTFTAALATGTAMWLLMRANASGALQLIIWQMSVASGRTKLLSNALKGLIKSPIFWAAAVASAVAIISYAMNRYIKKAKEARDALTAELAGKEPIRLINYKIELAEQKETHQKYLSELQKMLFAKQKLFNAASSKIRQTEAVMFGILEDQLSDHVSAAKELFEGLKDTIADLPSKLKSIAKETYDIGVNILDWKFERSLKGLNEVDEANARIYRSQQLRAAATAAAARGEHDLAKTLNERAMSEANSAEATADQVNNARLSKDAEAEKLAVFNNQLSASDKLKKDTISQAEAVEKQLKAMERLVKTLEQQETQYKSLIKQLEKTTDPVDREKILAKLKLVAKDIEDTIGKPDMNINFANSDELSKELAALSQNFYDSLTGQVTTFEQAITASVGRINALRAKTPDVSEQQANVVEMGNQIDIATKALVAQDEAEGKILDTLKLIKSEREVFIKQFEQMSHLQRKGDTAEQKAKEISQNNLILQQLDLRLIRLNGLIAAGKTNTAEFAEELTVLTKIRDIISEEYPGGPFGLGKNEPTLDSIDKMIKGYSEIVDLQEAAFAEAEKAEVGKTMMDRVEAAADPLKEYERISREATENMKRGFKEVSQEAVNTGETTNEAISAGASAAAAGVQASSASMISSLQAVAAQARATAAAVAAAGSGSYSAKGGMIYRAGGGFTPRGTDTVPAMLTPGEFVVNAASSRRFFSQLVAMNSGIQPVYRETGGSVGDININVTESKTPQATAREVASEIRRGIQRKTIRKF